MEIYDAYYDSDAHYAFVRDTLSSLREDHGEPRMTMPFSPETKVLTSDGEPLGEPAYSVEKAAALPDEVLFRLALPEHYDIRFETETYRSGKRHVKKTRYKDDPRGKIIGRHDGVQFYTVGQRKGLNIGGHDEPVFVIGADIEKNILYVGEGHSHKGLYRSCILLPAKDLHWIREDLRMKPWETCRRRVRIRYRQPLQGATLIMREAGLFILFDAPQRAVSSGQFAVWYDGDEMIGSGVI